MHIVAQDFSLKIAVSAGYCVLADHEVSGKSFSSKYTLTIVINLNTQFLDSPVTIPRILRLQVSVSYFSIPFSHRN